MMQTKICLSKLKGTTKIGTGVLIFLIYPLSSIAFNFRRHEEFKRSIKRGTLKRLSLKSYLQLRLVKELRMSMLLLVLALTHCALTVPANIAMLLHEIWPDFWSHLRGNVPAHLIARRITLPEKPQFQFWSKNRQVYITKFLFKFCGVISIVTMRPSTRGGLIGN